MRRSLADRIAAVAALDEPTRRRLYDYVVRSTAPVGRDEAAGALNIRRATAAFHLDRLATEGLLEVVHQRLSGRSGPGAGRPSKLYLRSPRSVSVALPGRRYDIAGLLLADAFSRLEGSPDPPEAVLAERARAHGARMVGEVGAAIGSDPSVPDVLEACDYEPRSETEGVVLANCPFHTLAAEHTALVCRMNLHFVEGVVEECGDPRTPQLSPENGRCCVRLLPAGK